MKKEKSQLDKLTETFNSDLKDALEINIDENIGEGTYIGWTTLYQVTKFNVEDLKKDALEAAEQCFFEAFDEINDTYQERKEEIIEKLKDMDIAIQEVKETLIKNKEDIEAINEINQFNTEIEDLINRLAL